MDIRTAPVTRGPLRRTIRTVGVIDYNETALADVTTRFKGWIEKLLRGRHRPVGDARRAVVRDLFARAIQRPTGISAGAGARNQCHRRRRALRTSALTKLKFLNISDEQIAELERTRAAQQDTCASSPRRDGFVVEKMVVEGQMVDAGHEDSTGWPTWAWSGSRPRSTSRTWRISSWARTPRSRWTICPTASSAGE